MKLKIFSQLLCCFLAITVMIHPVPASVSAAVDTPLLTYTESIATLNNPERGFYDSCYINAKESGTPVKAPEGKLVHLRIGLGEFSHEFLNSTANRPADYTAGGWKPLSDDLLSALNRTMENIRKNGGTAIVRFAYDNFDGIPDMEPEMNGILYHIRQLEPFFTNNEDVILAVESGFVGCYGEQHSSRIVSPSYSETTEKTIYTVVNALLDVVPSSISVTVRRPTYAAYACGMTMEQLKNTEFSADDKYYRVGVFNDGMFGSESDLGTYRNRAEEIAWLNRQAAHTVYGGETNHNRSTDGKDYTSGNYVCREMFQTHVTYLNDSWPEDTITNWKNTVYNGNDTVYAGQSTYTFFENHMGYRYVLRNFEAESNTVHFSIENVGAGNMLKEKKTSLILTTETGSFFELPTDIDVRGWETQTTSEETVSLNIKDGTYHVYLKITDTNDNQVQLANDNPFNEHGNLIGTVTVTDSSVTEPPAEHLPDYDTDGSFFIRNEEDLFTFAKMAEKNITLDARLSENIYLTQAWIPVASYAGTFDGNGFSIYNMMVNGEGQEYQGFIGRLESGGQIIDLSLKSGYVNGDTRIGAIAGRARENTLIENCSSDLSISGNYRAAGIVGYCQGTVRNCVNYGNISASDTAAGIAAYLTAGTVSGCSNYGTVTGDYKTGGISGDCYGNLSDSVNYSNISGAERVGGITGYANSAVITNCKNRGTITSSDEMAAGIVGYLNNNGSIRNCENTGKISGNKDAGGIVGYCYESNASDCTNSGRISGTYRTGGVIGYLKVSTLKNGSNSGNVTGVKYYGDVIGYNNSGTVL